MESSPQTPAREKIKDFFKTTSWIFGLYFRLSPFRTVLLFITGILSNLQSIFYAYIFARIIDIILKLAQTRSSDFHSLIPYIAVLLGYSIFFDAIVTSVQGYARSFFRLTSRNRLDAVLYQHIYGLGIQTLENPEVNNLILRSNQWLYDTLDVFLEGVNIIAQIMRAGVSAFVIFTFSPILIPILIVVTIIEFVPDRYFSSKNFHWQIDTSEERRIAHLPARDLSDPHTLQEITIVGGFEYLNKKFVDFFDWFNKGSLKIINQRQFAHFGTSVLDDTANIFSYAVVFFHLLKGTVSVGIATFQIRAIDNFFGASSSMLNSLSIVNDLSVKMDDIVKLFKLQPSVPDGTIRLRQLVEPPGIEFKNVTFSYPNSEKKIFDDFNLKIDSGEKIAIVGANGAGKTTLIKLLARFYKVQGGGIHINTIDINNLRIDEWYKNIGILFQDFNTYGYMTARENIIMGKPIQEVYEQKVQEAAHQADADGFIQAFKNGYDQILSERFKDGIRPSGGQWQKIAIARFFYRNASLVIFDEPTSSIDAVSEYKIFNRIYEFFKNKTVIIVSHRFSTVRNADRIIVMDKGQIIEQGSHEELLKMNGMYAHAFKLQAEGYR